MGAVSPTSGDGIEILQNVLNCRGAADSAQRLACYDKAVGAFAEAERTGDVVVADRAKIRETKRSLFGFVSRPLPIFGEHDHEAEPLEIDAKIVSAHDTGYGKWSFVLDNGMRWQQTDTADISPRAGDDVVIKHGALGSYFLKVARQRIIRVTRIG